MVKNLSIILKIYGLHLYLIKMIVKILWSWFDLFVLLGEKYFKAYGYVKGWEPVTKNENLEEKKE